MLNVSYTVMKSSINIDKMEFIIISRCPLNVKRDNAKKQLFDIFKKYV